MILFRVDWRALFSVLSPVSRLYVLLLTAAAAWSVLSLFRFLRLIQRMRRATEPSPEDIRSKLATQLHNLRQLVFLSLLPFGLAFFTELVQATRGWWFVTCNPNADVVGPFDAVLGASQLSFAILALMQGMAWYMSAKLAFAAPQKRIGNFTTSPPRDKHRQ